MARLSRFEDHRYIGTRDDMRAYDCDDEAQFEMLSARVVADELLGRGLLQTFAPDTATDARNRGFHPTRN
ncbi:MAG: hypothetical protein BMS9Abin20_1494 [Acidimicrobiia bacterium]|nr:MAG: hypothetical protein BMS9Abin20_1494 [Acidimicrobiia bacterium]